MLRLEDLHVICHTNIQVNRGVRVAHVLVRELVQELQTVDVPSRLLQLKTIIQTNTGQVLS